MSSEEKLTVRNALIEKAEITSGDHGLLSAWVFLDYGGSGQGFGGYALYLPKDWKNAKEQANYAGHFIWRVLEIAGVEDWSRLKGKTIRVRCSFGKVHEIGHILKEDWFNPEADFAALKTSGGAA